MILDSLVFSKHAKERMEQRRIDLEDIESIMVHGEMFNAGNNAYSYWVSDKIVKQNTFNFEEIKEIKDIKNKAVVVSSDGVVITVARYKQPEHHWQKV